jgi:hypothetical protein
MGKLSGAVPVAVEFVFADLTAEGISVNTEDLRRAGLIAIGAVENALYKTFFELANGFVE